MLTHLKPSRQPRLLVIDRDPSIRSLVDLLLEGRYQVDHALSGALALANMKKERYQLIIASLDLPRGSGFHRTGIVSKIRRVPGYKHVPLISMVPEDHPDLLDELEPGASQAFLKKPALGPFTKAALEDAIATAVKQTHPLAA